MNPRSRNRFDLFRTSALLFPPDFHTLYTTTISRDSFCQCATAAGVLPLSPQNRCFFYGLWQKFEPAKIQGWENSGSTTCCYSAVSDLRIDKQNLQYKVCSNHTEVTFSEFEMKKLWQRQNSCVKMGSNRGSCTKWKVYLCIIQTKCKFYTYFLTGL